MKTQQAILIVMENILGLDQAEMSENTDLNLFDSGLVDSLAMVTLITELEESIHHSIDIKQMRPEDLLTINRLAEAIDNQITHENRS